MAAMTVVRSGEWTDTGGGTTPWTALTGSGPGGVPGIGDTVTCGAFTVTVAVGNTANIGTSPQDITTRVWDGTNNNSKLIVYGTLNIYGNFAMNGGNAGGSYIQADASTGGAGTITIMSSANVTTPNRYRAILGYAGASNPSKIIAIGSLSNRARIAPDVPGTTMWDINNHCALKVVNADFVGCTSALDAQDTSAMSNCIPSPNSIGQVAMETSRAKFQYCGLFTLGNPAAACTSSISRTTFTNSACRRYSIAWNGNANNICTVDRLVMDMPQGQVGSNVRYTHLFVDGKAGGSGYPTASSTITGRYGILKNRTNNQGTPSTVSGAVKDVVRWTDNSTRTITGVETTNKILTLGRPHTFATSEPVRCSDYNSALPTGLVNNVTLNDPYYAYIVSTTEVILYDTLANANAGGIGVATGRINITGSTPGGMISAENAHWGGYLVTEGQIYVLDGLASNGDGHNGPTAGSSATVIVEDNIGMQTPGGGGCAVLISPLSSGTYNIHVNRNTWPLTNPYALTLSGETYTAGHTGMYSEIQANLMYAPAYESGTDYAVYNSAILSATVNPLTPTGAKGNWIDGGTTYDAVGEVYDLGGPAVQTAPDFLSASPPDLVNTASNMIDPTRSMDSWAAWWGTRIGAAGDGITTPGTQATYENATLLCARAFDGTFDEDLTDDTYRLCVEYLRRGLTPTNITGRAVSVSSRTAGAYYAWAPALSAQTATAALGNVTTNCGDGTLYWIISVISTAPDWDRIIAAKDSTGTTVAAGFSGNQAVSADGVQNITLSGASLAPATNYYLHVAHSADATANGDAAQDSYLRTSETVTSAAFQAAASVPLFMHNTFMRSAA